MLMCHFPCLGFGAEPLDFVFVARRFARRDHIESDSTVEGNLLRVDDAPLAAAGDFAFDAVIAERRPTANLAPDFDVP